MGTGATLVRRRLDAHPSSVGEARRLVRGALTDAGRHDLAENAELLVSEVVTNALVHAGTAVELSATVEDEGPLRIEVQDGSTHLPVTRDYSELAGTGRGLRMLEQLVDRWGVHPKDDGKVVWFELGAPGSQGTTAPEMTAQDRPVPAAVEVVLLNVPLLMHAAWQMQSESILREHLLARLDDETGTEEIETHAAVNDAMALLQEQIPAPELGEDPDAVMAGATEPLVSQERLVLSVPTASLPHFELLDRTLDSAMSMADAGAYLTPPTQPELRMFRRWLCDQVDGQSHGGPPVPWLTSAGVVPWVAPLAGWDRREVESAPTAVLAADDANRILAASASAAALLGYRPEELTRCRLVDIIPARYHQAHLAGFTLHLFAGRSALIGTPVVVPALRRDGNEVTVSLTVTAQPVPSGRRVFVASMTPA